ncbi:MAG: hypothetical protein MAG715_01189 [Methanonatronarchaeales archaeon]|nr:hypothetical protein [Methanonatronarchaeales archaeon]
MLAEGEDGKVPTAVLMDSFVVSASPPFASKSMDPGDTPTHSVSCRQAGRNHDSDCDCRFCEGHGPRSTLAEERFVHREALENLHEKLFSSVTGGEPREAPPPASLKINGGSEKKEEAEGKEVSEGDTVETGRATRADLNDEKGNRLTLGPRNHG